MTRFIVPRRLLPAALGLVLAALCAGIAQAGPTAPDAPDEVAVAEGHKVFLIADAVGVQIHACELTGGGYRWRFLGPRADLYDDQGHLLGTHFAGPRWQTRDGSTVTAVLDDNAAITVDPTAIPWLRLRVTSATAGADGHRLGATTYIQRLDTAGGLAPAALACNAGTLGDVAEIPYTAVYAFWKATDR